MKSVTGDDNVQTFDTDYCGPLRMYFYLRFFEPLKGSVVARGESKKLDVKLLEELLNKIFNTNTRQNKRILEAFILQHAIEFDGEDVPFSDCEMEEVYVSFTTSNHPKPAKTSQNDPKRPTTSHNCPQPAKST